MGGSHSVRSSTVNSVTGGEGPCLFFSRRGRYLHVLIVATRKTCKYPSGRKKGTCPPGVEELAGSLARAMAPRAAAGSRVAGLSWSRRPEAAKPGRKSANWSLAPHKQPGCDRHVSCALISRGAATPGRRGRDLARMVGATIVMPARADLGWRDEREGASARTGLGLVERAPPWNQFGRDARRTRLRCNCASRPLSV